MLRMAVCDKEEETCSLIKALAEESIGCKVWTFHSDTELLESKEKYDILLLDIGNGEPTGIETARKIRRCYDPILIFIAEGKKHVLDVFDVEAFHYLLKPIDEEKLKEVLKKSGKPLQTSKGKGTVNYPCKRRKLLCSQRRDPVCRKLCQKSDPSFRGKTDCLLCKNGGTRGTS